MQLIKIMRKSGPLSLPADAFTHTSQPLWNVQNALYCNAAFCPLHTGMAKKPGTNKSEFVFFDVVYEDGSQRPNGRVPADLPARP